jgi:hypothetical protein
VRRAGAVLLASLVIAAPAAAGAAPGPTTPVSSSVVRQDPAAVRAYWTPARMRAAKPAELLLDSEAAPRGATAAQSAGTPQRLSAVETGGESGFPNRTHGKVFFTLDGDDFLCSGSVVTSPGRSLAVSAAHCVYDGSFASNWMFVPGYRDGNQPYGEWAAEGLAVPSQWDGNDFSYDVGMATLARNGNGEGIEDIVGARGIAFNQSRDQTFSAYGYPVEDNLTVFPPRFFDGERLYVCVSGRIGDFNPGGASGPDMIEISCDMTGGSSGGGWVIDGQFVNSVVSLGTGTEIDGPYFGSVIEALYRNSRGEAQTCDGIPVTNLGTSGSDDFTGDGGADSFSLRSGNDSAQGMGGNDRLCGGSGRDHLVGGPGFDVCKGGSGRDSSKGCEVKRSIP